MVIIDTLAAARELEAAGIEPKHAEAIVSIQCRTVGELATKADLENFATKIKLDDAVSKLATKADLDAAFSKLATRAELREFKSELELKIEKAKFGLSRWMMTGWVAQTGVLATLYWYFSSGLPGD